MVTQGSTLGVAVGNSAPSVIEAPAVMMAANCRIEFCMIFHVVGGIISRRRFAICYGGWLEIGGG
jgi:hypothetical protein